MKWFVSVCVVLCCAQAQASLIGYYPGNDNATVVSDIVGHDVILLGKIETEGLDLTYEGLGDQVSLTYTPFDGTGLGYTYLLASLPKEGQPFMSGELISDLDIEYFAAKAGNGFNLYNWEDGVINEWSTVNTCHQLSHLSFYGPKVSVVPEPSSFAMVGIFTVLGGVFYGRKRRLQHGDTHGYP